MGLTPRVRPEETWEGYDAEAVAPGDGRRQEVRRVIRRGRSEGSEERHGGRPVPWSASSERRPASQPSRTPSGRHDRHRIPSQAPVKPNRRHQGRHLTRATVQRGHKCPPCVRAPSTQPRHDCRQHLHRIPLRRIGPAHPIASCAVNVATRAAPSFSCSAQVPLLRLCVPYQMAGAIASPIRRLPSPTLARLQGLLDGFHQVLGPPLHVRRALFPLGLRLEQLMGDVKGHQHRKF